MNLLYKKSVSFFLSRNVAITLLILMTVILVVSTQLPNFALMTAEEVAALKVGSPFLYAVAASLGERGITSSPWFYVIPGFIFLSTFLCTIDRLINTRNRSIGFWGSMFFHAGLLTIIVAAVVTRLTLFEAELLLTEGYPLSLGKAGFLTVGREPLAGIDFPEGNVMMTKFKSIYEGPFPIDHEALISIDRDGTVSNTSIKVNQPMNIEGLQYSLNRYGFAPAFVVKDSRGNILLDAFINLVVVGSEVDSFEVPGANAVVDIIFLPDFEMTDEGPVSRSAIPNNPVVALKVRKDGMETKYLHVKMGDSGNLMGLEISFPEFKYWAHILVSRDRGVPFFLAGFLIAVFGLLVRYITMMKTGESYEA
ncbi:MAG: cytochrome c biogenesis protein ResB [bacterium]|nr:cytochrome c biogenesis protein ResB [bacterium]